MNDRVNQSVLCAVCHQPYYEWGHDAHPVTRGRCCNACNGRVVIPARLRWKRAAAAAAARQPAKLRAAAEIGRRR